MAKFLLIGQADHDNFGDSLIYYCYLAMLRDCGHDADILNSSPKFISRIEALGIDVNAISSKDILSIEKSYDGAIFVPGGYFGCPDFTDVLWQKKWIAADYFKTIFENINKLSIPVYVHGAEVGPLTKPIVFKYFENVIKTAKITFVRNLGSQLYIKRSMNVNSTVLPDFILSLKDFFKIDYSIKNFDLGIHITGKIFADNVLSRNFSKSLESVIIKNKIKNILLFSDQPIPERFRDAISKFTSRIKNSANANIEVRDYDSMLSVIKNAAACRTLITSKLHVGVTGLVYDTKVLCIASHPKLKRFYHDNNLSVNYINYFLTSSSKKEKQISSLLQMNLQDYQSEKLKTNISQTLEIYKETLNEIVNDVLKEERN